MKITPSIKPTALDSVQMTTITVEPHEPSYGGGQCCHEEGHKYPDFQREQLCIFSQGTLAI